MWDEAIRIAYAYLMYRPDKSLTEVSEKRLEAIKGFTELGSGFKIAMRDLSIRGAGNILELLNLVSSIQLVLKCILNC